MAPPFLFCLGGRDLEMVEIGGLVRATLGDDAVLDRGLPWHRASASAYRDAIEAALAEGRTPVLLELRDDLPPALSARCRHLDHHGPDAGAEQPTSLEQTFALLGLPAHQWTRRLTLVTANDRGWIPELRSIGASAAEIAAIRAEDRAVQGITPADESAAAAAIEARESQIGGSLLLVRLPHDRTATVFDRLAMDVPGDAVPDTLVVGPNELNFSGTGNRVHALAATYPEGWSGGALPERGFWGHAAPLPPLADVLDVIAGA